jgi:cell division protein FtsA
MAKSTIYAGLEIGTHKICVVVGEAKRDGAIKILGVGQAPSRGVRKGEIVDFEKVQTCVNDALVRAEDRSDVMIRNVFLGVTGAHIESLNNRGRHRLPDDQTEITEDAAVHRGWRRGRAAADWPRRACAGGRLSHHPRHPWPRAERHPLRA